MSKIFCYQYVTWKCFWHLHSLNMVLFWQLFYLFVPVFKYCYSDSRSLWTVITVFIVFRLLTDFVCLYNYEFWLSLCKIVRSSVILLLPLSTIQKMINFFCNFPISFKLLEFYYLIMFCRWHTINHVLDEVKRIIDIFLERHNIELVREHFILDVHEGEITKDLLNWIL